MGALSLNGTCCVQASSIKGQTILSKGCFAVSSSCIGRQGEFEVPKGAWTVAFLPTHPVIMEGNAR